MCHAFQRSTLRHQNLLFAEPTWVCQGYFEHPAAAHFFWSEGNFLLLLERIRFGEMVCCTLPSISGRGLNKMSSFSRIRSCVRSFCKNSSYQRLPERAQLNGQEDYCVPLRSVLFLKGRTRPTALPQQDSSTLTAVDRARNLLPRRIRSEAHEAPHTAFACQTRCAGQGNCRRLVHHSTRTQQTALETCWLAFSLSPSMVVILVYVCLGLRDTRA